MNMKKNTLMKRNKKHVVALAALTLAVALSGCKDEMADNVQTPGAQKYVYQVEVSAEGDGRQSTRSLSEQENHLLESAWQKGDKMTIFNADNQTNQSNETDYCALQAVSNGKASIFGGQVVSTRPITTHSRLCFLYPGGLERRYIRAVNETTEKQTRFYEPSEKIQPVVEINFTLQDGTIETIGKKFDLQWAAGIPKAVRGNNIRLSLGKLQRKVAFLGLRFADKKGKILTDIDSVTISNVCALDQFDLPTGQFLRRGGDKNSISIVPNGKNGKFTSAGGKYVYAAMMPGRFSEVLIAAYVKDKCYARLYPSMTFDADKVYRMDVLQMENVTDKPFVEVEGVKWATGNFIHYYDPNFADENYPNGEYWGIAPTQWYISDYAAQNPDLTRPKGSQFISSYEARENDLDTWRWGDIKEALKLNSGYCRSGFIRNVSKTFYTTDQAIIGTETQDRNRAVCGDLVWYHTMLHNQKYKLPTLDQVKLLYTRANVFPAYCYTDKGNKVYGAYFTTCRSGEQRFLGFPTGPRQLYKYINVTTLVRAGRGLFLPITGRRNAHSKIVGYRDMLYPGGYAQYQTSWGGTTTELCSFFIFGPTARMVLEEGSRTFACGIRPVWDESSLPEDKPNPRYKGFENMR